MHINGIALCPKHHKFGIESAHRNPLWFFMQLEKFYPLKLKVLKLKYTDGRKNKTKCYEKTKKGLKKIKGYGRRE